MMSEYEAQAQEFLRANNLTIKVAFKGEKLPPWSDPIGRSVRQHYRVTIKRIGGPGVSFDFWGSIHDAAMGKAPSAYSVLAAVSGDIHCPDTFEEFCADYGYDPDSRKAEAIFKAASAFMRKLRAFFTPAEIEALGEIQ